MNNQRKKNYIIKLLSALGISLLFIPLLLHGRQHFLRPMGTIREKMLFQGIIYQRNAVSIPRPVMIHVVAIDLATSGIKAFVTPGTKGKGTKARTASEFLGEFKLQLALNASYFQHFREKTPWDYYPYSGDPSYPIGEAISDGNRYAQPRETWPVFCISQNNRIQILVSTKCSEDTISGVAGREILVKDGQPLIIKSKDDKPYARVAAAIDKENKKLWLIVVDGKQPEYSEGLTNAELAKFIASLGAQTAIGLDGGGSATLVMATNNGISVLNAPIHTKIPMRERPVANHLGFYAVPINANLHTDLTPLPPFPTREGGN
ncbi:MAG: phosphodiester glycosidase family protein [Scytonematopsis contorta HA4267-MV1]|jgi:hypothetical protein|nr:phosphodiester glycosidase family protein [Scytonematopsis contorta HA4267-MV1]